MGDRDREAEGQRETTHMPWQMQVPVQSLANRIITCLLSSGVITMLLYVLLSSFSYDQWPRRTKQLAKVESGSRRKQGWPSCRKLILLLLPGCIY